MGIQTVGAYSRRPQVATPSATPAPVGLRGMRLIQFGSQAAPAAPQAPAPITPQAPAPDVFVRPAPVPLPRPRPERPRPVARPLPVAPAKPAPVAPARPAPVAPPAPAAPAAPAIDLSGLRPGQRFSLDRGTKIQGHSISGEAVVQRFDGQTLELLVDASAAMGFVRMQLKIRCEALPDGRMRITAEELGRSGAPEKTHFDDQLKVITSRRDEIVLQGPDGQPGALRMAAGGVVVLEHPAAGRIVLRPS